MNILWIISSLAFLGPVTGLYKRWRSNTEFTNPENWNVGRVPCENDRVVFPDSAPAVFMQTNTTFVELVLPSDGEMVLGNYMSIGFPTPTAESKKDCPGDDVKFTRTGPADWFDPENWCETATPDGDCLSSPPERLETERVPCKRDDIVFPALSSFYVSLGSGVDVYVGSLMFGGQKQTTGGFRKFIDSHEGKEWFYREEGQKTTINIMDTEPCDEEGSGCACENDQGQIMDKICSTVKDNCLITPCSSPQMPEGACCPICGVVIEMDYGHNFRFKRLSSAIKRDYLRHYDNVAFIMSKTSHDRIQIVLRDSLGGTDAISVGKQIKAALDSDIAAGSLRFGITFAHMSTSGSVEPTFGKLTGGSGPSLSSTTMVGIVLGILILLGVIVIIVFVYMRRDRFKLPTLRLPFKRMEEEEGGSTMEMAFKELPEGATFQSVQGFENPTYDTVNVASGGLPTIGTHGNGHMNGDGPAILDPTEVTFQHDFNGGMTGTGSSGFFNPMYQQTQEDPPSVKGKVVMAQTIGGAPFDDSEI